MSGWTGIKGSTKHYFIYEHLTVPKSHRYLNTYRVSQPLLPPHKLNIFETSWRVNPLHISHFWSSSSVSPLSCLLSHSHADLCFLSPVLDPYCFLILSRLFHPINQSALNHERCCCNLRLSCYALK